MDESIGILKLLLGYLGMNDLSISIDCSMKKIVYDLGSNILQIGLFGLVQHMQIRMITRIAEILMNIYIYIPSLYVIYYL